MGAYYQGGRFMTNDKIIGKIGSATYEILIPIYAPDLIKTLEENKHKDIVKTAYDLNLKGKKKNKKNVLMALEQARRWGKLDSIPLCDLIPKVSWKKL